MSAPKRLATIAVVAGVTCFVVLAASARVPTNKPESNLPSPTAKTAPHARTIRPSKTAQLKGKKHTKVVHTDKVANRPK